MKTVMFCTTISLLCTVSLLQAQPDIEWSTTFWGHPTLNSAVRTDDGGLVMAGDANAPFNFWLVRTDTAGATIWSHNYGGRPTYGAKTTTKTSDGGFAVAGRTGAEGAGSGDFWLLRVDGNGELLWSKTYGGYSDEECQSMLATEDGGLILAGYTASFGNGNVDGWIIRLNADGDSLWSLTLGGAAYDCIFSIIATTDGNFVAGGSSKSYNGDAGDFWLSKISSDGDSLWSYTYGQAPEELCYDVMETSDSGFVLAGSTRTPRNGLQNYHLLKTDSDGDSLWSKSYGGDSEDIAYSVIETNDNGIAVLGSTNSIRVNREDYWLLRLDENGDSLWSKPFRIGSYNVGKELIQTEDDNFIMVGSSSVGAWLVKTTPDGLSISDSPSTLSPSIFNLYPAYPNPFNSMVTIPFAVGAQGLAPLQMAVFDPLGRRVAELIPNSYPPFNPPPASKGGKYAVIWDANGMPAGLYTVRLQAPGVTLSQPLVLTK